MTSRENDLYRDNESANRLRNTENKLVGSDEELTLETSASESLYGGQFTLSTQLIKPNYLVLPQPRTDYLKRSFLYSGAQLWDNLPVGLRQAPSLTDFKSKLSRHSFK